MFLEKGNIATILVLIAAAVGGVVVIIGAITNNTASLNFEDYFQTVLVGAGLLGIGRGLKSAGKPTGPPRV